MATSEFSYSVTSRQETYSVAYISAIAARVGFSVSMNPIDEDSIDFSIHQKSGLTGRPWSSTLKIQAKCRSNLSPNRDGRIPVQIHQKNYDDLRALTGDVHILAVLEIPSQDESTWITEKANSMELFNAAYWVSLRGMPAWPPSDRKPTERFKTVYLPSEQRLDAGGLLGLMDTIARGEFPA